MSLIQEINVTRRDMVWHPYGMSHVVEGMCTTEWCRDIGCLVFIGHFPLKSPVICGSFAFAEHDLQLKASFESSPPCIAT